MARKKDKITDRQRELIEQLVRESGGPQALFDYPKHVPIVPRSGNKTIIVDNDQLEIQSSRDRNGTFERQLIPKLQTRFKG